MAEPKQKRIAIPGIKFEECYTWDEYRGSKANLIAAGICKASWFPKKLVAQVRGDGKPYLGNNGKQRRRRTYPVDGVIPETTVTQRLTADGEEIWIIRVDNPKRRAEQERRRKEWEEECRAVNTGAAGDVIEPATLEGLTFEVGDSAIWYGPGYDYHQQRVKITRGYGPYVVDNEDGTPARKRWGYVYKGDDGKEAFAAAHRLRDRMDRPAHLKLIPDAVEVEDEPHTCPHCGAVRQPSRTISKVGE